MQARDHHIGRIAYSLHDRVDVEPIHYVYDAPWIYGRTSAGAKLLTLAHNQWCAIETDDVKGMFDWQSVVVHGSAQLLDPHDGPDAAARWQHAVDTFRRIIPQAFQTGDPTPQRDVMLRVHMSHVEGRAASTTAA